MMYSNLDGRPSGRLPPGRKARPSPSRSALAQLAAGLGGRTEAAGAGDPEMLASIGNAARWLRSVPPRMRDAAFERIAPMLSFLPPALIEQVRRSPKDDRALDEFIGELARAVGGPRSGRSTPPSFATRMRTP